jgi:hypothetical protein
MVSITYDINNSIEQQMVDDYFFYKYYVESLKFDWGHLKLNQQYELENIEIIKP